MKVDAVRDKVKGIPGMSYSQAVEISGIIRENGYREVLELGFAHGVSTCYIANTLKELGGGHITTVDLEVARTRVPCAEDLLEDLALSDMVTIYFEPTSYTWRLMKMLETDSTPRFDLCYLDGAHDWATDGFAFLLVDRLLKVGGMIIFDDLDWTFAKSPSLGNTDYVKNMPRDERETPQIRKVYELLVKTHPSYDHFMQSGDWAYATKMDSESHATTGPVRTEIVYRTKYVGLRERTIGKFANWRSVLFGKDEKQNC